MPALPALPPQPVPQVPPAPQPHDLSRIAQDLQIRKAQVEAVVQLLDEENTVPFITRYRKERTGGLNEEVIRRIQERVGHLRDLADRKQTILKSIAGQGRLNDALTQASSRPSRRSGSKTSTCRSSRRRSRWPPRPARRASGRSPRRSGTATRPWPISPRCCRDSSTPTSGS